MSSASASITNMALQNLHEMIRNFSSYIKCLEVLCDKGLTLAKNFERLLSPATSGAAGPNSASASALDSDLLQSVTTWELMRSRIEIDSNALISELLPILQEAVQNVMKDQNNFHSNNTFEVFRSCFSAFFQIQWRFCSLYLQCTGTYPSYSHYPARTPDSQHALARSPTGSSFNSSSATGDRRESCESCFSTFSSLPRSSFSSISSRSSSPQNHHGMGISHHGGFHNRSSRNSSPSVKFTPSQPPSPLLPFGDTTSYPHLFRRWSTHTHTHNYNPTSNISPSASSNISGMASYASSSGGSNISSSVFGSSNSNYNRRWSVPASCHNQSAHSSDASKKPDNDYEYGILDAINLLSNSKKPQNTPSTIINESLSDFGPLIEQHEQTRSLWPPSDSMPGVILTTCTESDQMLTLDNLHRHHSSHQSLRVPFGETPTTSSSIINQISQPIQLEDIGEYSLFGNNSPTPTQQGT